MKEIVTLNELAKSSENIGRFGLKAEGLAELIKKNDGSYIVDEGFAISVDNNGKDSPELKDKFRQLTSQITSTAILMARSSDPEEIPGKFESHTFIHYPGEKSETSYKDFLEAVEKVKASGARAIVCQIGAMEQNKVDVDWNHKGPGTIKEDAFGSLDTGFVYNTKDRFGKGSVITAVRGLPSKIVRGDRDICMIQNNGGRIRVVNLNNNYQWRSFGEMNQDSLDVIKLSDPKKIVTQMRVDRISGGETWGDAQIPFFLGGGYGEMEKLFYTLGSLKTDERELEIEGSCIGLFDMTPHLFQLRHYETPKERLAQLTDISKDRILSGPFPSYVADRIEGNLSFVDQGDYEKIKPGQVIFCRDYDSLIYGMKTEATEKFVKELQNRGAMGVVIPVKHSSGLYSGVHEMGVMTQELWLLQKKIPAIAMDAEHMNELEMKVAGQIIPDVVVESDSKNGQVYHK